MKRIVRRNGAKDTVNAIWALTQESEASMSSTCPHTDELLTLGAMHLLSVEDEARLAERLRSCPACRARWEEYQTLAAALPRLVMAETAPSAVVRTNTTPSLNGKTPAHLPMLRITAQQQEEQDSDISGLSHLVAKRSKHHHTSQQLVSIMSSLAAVIVLVGLVGGFWLLTLGRTHGPLKKNGISAAPTAVIGNACIHPAANQTGQATCALVVMNYAATPPTLVALDPATDKPLPGLKPLPVGNALLAAASADRHVLALGVIPSNYVPGDQSDPPYIQMVSLDSWRLGPKMLVGDEIQALAMTTDGSNIYAVSGTYNQDGSTQAFLHYYTYNRRDSTWAHPWRSSLPFLPDNQSSFALSADGKTAYLFSAAIQTPELVAVSLKVSSASSSPTLPRQQLPLPSIAPGGEPSGDSNYIYQPGDTIAEVYQPAAIFAPTQNRLYIVHTEKDDVTQEVIAVVNLAQMSLIGQDIPVHGANLPLAREDSLPSLPAHPQLALKPAKGRPYNGQSVQATISPDEQWIYMSETTYTAQISNGVWSGESQKNLGMWQVNAQTGQVVKQWDQGNAYFTLTMSQDGKELYCFGPPPVSNPSNSLALLIFNPAQGRVVSWFDMNTGSFIVVLSQAHT